MARICDICGKKPLSGNRVSHANNKTRRRWLPNLKNFRLSVKGVTKSMKLCTRCIRSQNLNKMVSAARKLTKHAGWIPTPAPKA